MRNVVIQDTFSETDIRPGGEASEYVAHVKRDARAFFKSELIGIECPGCLLSEYSTVFDRFGFDYVECSKCGTVFMNPRPPQEVVDDYYNQSGAARFWRDELLRVSEAQRKEHIYIPRLNWLSRTVKKCRVESKRYIDVYSKYREMLRHIGDWLPFDNGYVYRPMNHENTVNGFEKIESLGGDESLNLNVATMFEVVERVSSPDAVVKSLRNNLARDALLFLTTSTIDGFEHQVLWDDSKNIFPPDHMTVFSIKGLEELLRRNQLKVVELSTPGILDVDIVRNEMLKGDDFRTHRFLTRILASDDDELRADFQRFLQRNRLSSHIRVACQAV